MERDLMYKIYGMLWANKEEWSLENIRMYQNLERQWCVKFEHQSETYVISNDLINMI